MKIFYVHNTPLAGLVAINRTVSGAGGDPISNRTSAFLRLRENFMYAGKDHEGRELYAVWFRSDRQLLPRLIDSFCTLHDIPGDQYAIHPVQGASDFRLGLVTLAYRLGLYGLAHMLLERMKNVSKSLAAPRLAGVD